MFTPLQVRQVRTLIPDTDQVFGDGENEYLFADSNIEDFLAAAGGSILRAAGYANLAIASSEALISKKIRTQDLQTDGAAVANALINKANALFQQADKVDSQAVTDYFEIVNFRQGWYPDSPELTEFDVYGNQVR